MVLNQMSLPIQDESLGNKTSKEELSKDHPILSHILNYSLNFEDDFSV